MASSPRRHTMVDPVNPVSEVPEPYSVDQKERNNPLWSRPNVDDREGKDCEREAKIRRLRFANVVILTVSLQPWHHFGGRRAWTSKKFLGGWVGAWDFWSEKNTSGVEQYNTIFVYCIVVRTLRQVTWNRWKRNTIVGLPNSGNEGIEERILN